MNMRPKVPKQPKRLELGRRARVKVSKHLDDIRTLPCLLTGLEGSTHAAHLRYGDTRYDKRETGMGERPDDRWAVPLCQDLHTMLPGAQHNHSERAWWKYFDVDPVRVAHLLWSYRSNVPAMIEVCSAFRPMKELARLRLTRVLNGHQINVTEGHHHVE